MKVALGDIIRPLGVPPPPSLATIPVTGVSTDSRSVKSGDLFIAIRGPRFDGHEFIPAVLKQGVAAVVADRTYAGPAHERVLRVDDTLSALGRVAHGYRAGLKARVIAVTGSNGKTTTKEMIAHILAKEAAVVRAKGSFNNAIGVPLTIFSADERTQYLVLEIGTNHPGEIKALGEIADPHIAVITSIAVVHLEGLGSIEGIVREKASLLDCLAPDGIAVINRDLSWYGQIVGTRRVSVVAFGGADGCEIAISRVTRRGEGVSFVVNGRIPVTLNVVGRWNAWNAAAAIAVCGRCGIAPEEAARRLEDFHLPYMRMERVERGGIVFFNDAYNANPASMAGALEEFQEMDWPGRRVAILGDMLELGAESRRLHEEIAEGILRRSGLGLVITVGKDSEVIARKVRSVGRESVHFDDTTSACRTIADILRAGDIVLLKASRGIGLERLLDKFSGLSERGMTHVS